MNKILRMLMLSAVVFATFSGGASADPSHKWRLVFDHWADNDGELVLRIAPEGGTPIDVSTQIKKNTTENSAAHLVRTALKAKLGKGYKVEIDDGEDVLIKAKGKTPKFEVSVASSTVTGLNLNVKHD